MIGLNSFEKSLVALNNSITRCVLCIDKQFFKQLKNFDLKIKFFITMRELFVHLLSIDSLVILLF